VPKMSSRHRRTPGLTPYARRIAEQKRPMPRGHFRHDGRTWIYISLFPPSCIRTLTGPRPGFQTGIIVSLFALWRCWRCERCRHVFDDRRRIVSDRLISNRKSRNVATFHRINQIALRSAPDGFAHWFFYRWRRLRECRRRQQEHDNSQFVHFIP
jgi:hypothetical protein